MKTPTLIVRLIGIYLVVQNTGALIQARKVITIIGDTAVVQKQILVTNQVYLAIGLIVGLIVVVFAGWLARILTFDSKE